MKRQAFGIVVILFFVLGVACGNPSKYPNPEHYPKFYVKHETVEYFLDNVGPNISGSAIGKPVLVTLLNGHPGVFFQVDGGAIKTYNVAYDFMEKRWVNLLTYSVDLPHSGDYVSVERYNEMQKLIIAAKEKYDNEFNKLILPILNNQKGTYNRHPRYWMDYDKMGWQKGPPAQAVFFSYDEAGGYETYKERVGGGAIGLEPSHIKQYSYFVGIKSTYYRSRLLFESMDEQMFDLTFVSKDFKTVIYKHRSVNSIKFTVIDLSETIDSEATTYVPQAASQPTSPR